MGKECSIFVRDIRQSSKLKERAIRIEILIKLFLKVKMHQLGKLMLLQQIQK